MISECRSRARAGAVLVVALAAAATASAQAPATPRTPTSVTFTKDIAPILQRSCQQCHNPDGGAPMSLITYEDVRPWARAIKTRTSIGPRAGVMPPWFVEKNIGIQHYKGDPSLSDEEIAKIAKWADSGAPRGNPADMPRREGGAIGEDGWVLGKPDLIVKSPEVFVPAIGARQVGLDRPGADRSHRGSLGDVGRSARGERHPARRRHQDRRRPLCVPSHDVSEPRCPGSAKAARAGRFTRSAATPTVSRRQPAGCSPPTRCSI